MSALGWVDFDPDDTEHARKILDIFASPEARDELGLGVIRDGFADLLFPGTSTIQTRLRYFVILPHLAVQAVQSARRKQPLGEALRLVEQDFIRQCQASGQVNGLIGREAGVDVKRMPSSVYWNGLATWGIRRNGPENILLTLERMAAEERCWDMPPVDGPLAGFKLGSDEKQFLIDKVSALRNRDGQTVLGWLFAHALPLSAQLGAVKELPDLGALLTEAGAPANLVHKVACANHLSAVMHGAALLYNLLIAEHLHEDKSADNYRSALEEWKGRRGPQTDPAALLAPLADLETWRALNPRTQAFIEAWFSVAWGNPDTAAARDIIKQREIAVKGRKSRLGRPRGSYEWSGASGNKRLDYRWITVQQFLSDLRA